MTSDEVAIRDQAPSTELIAAQVRNELTDGWIPVLAPIMELANAVQDTDFVPTALRGNAPAVGACIMFGREINVAPMHALQNIHIIEGRPSISAEQMRAMVLAEGHEIAFGETSGATCQIKGRRKGSTTWTVVEFTAAHAEAAGLLGKTNWRRYRPDMLIARASARLCRMIFADVVRGMRTTEELEDEADNSAAPIGGSTPASGGNKVSRKARTGPTATPPPVAAPSGSTRGEDIAPPAPPAAPAPKVEPAPVEATPGEGQSTPDTSTGPVAPPEELDEHGQEFIPEGDWMDAALGAAEALAEQVSGPVEPRPRPMHSAQTKALQARFRGLGYTDSEDDIEARHQVASAIVGREIESFRAGDDPGHMTYDEADFVMRTLAPCLNRDDVLATLVKIAQDARAEEEANGS